MLKGNIPGDSESSPPMSEDSGEQNTVPAGEVPSSTQADDAKHPLLTESDIDISQLLMESDSLIVVVLEHTGRILNLNGMASRLLGYPSGELVGRNWFDVAVPQEQGLNLKAMYVDIRAGHTGLPKQHQHMIRTRTGELRDIEWQNIAIVHGGQFEGCLAIGVDITDSAMAAAVLSDSEARYRRLFEAARDGILILDATTGTVVDVNPYLTELLGIEYEQLVGKKVWELGFLSDVSASQENFLELQQQEYIRYENLPLETADGEQIDAEFVSNVYRVNGDLVIQCNIRNITARKHAEKELRKLQAELETRIKERTDELSKATDALQSETIARISAEESQLAAVVEERTRIGREIHDTLAQGFTGIIIQLEAADDILLEDPQAAMHHFEQARQLARDSLAGARRSMWALRPQMLEKGDLTFAIGSLVENLTKETPINIDFCHEGQTARYSRHIEEGLLRICQEALMNAGKHANSENIQVNLNCRNEQLELSVEDDGQGFELRSLPFFRGLGMRIMKERAANLNGTCQISSKPGHGTHVLVHIPLDGEADGETND